MLSLLVNTSIVMIISFFYNSKIHNSPHKNIALVIQQQHKSQQQTMRQNTSKIYVNTWSEGEVEWETNKSCKKERDLLHYLLLEQFIR